MRVKKILFVFGLFALCISGYAQSVASKQPKVENSIWANPQKKKPCIVKDAVDKDNCRFLFGDYRVVSADYDNCDYIFHVSLNASAVSGIEQYSICLSIKGINKITRIDKDSPCLIKLGDDSVLELSCNSSVDDIGTIRSNYVSPGTYTEYIVHPMYQIKEEQLALFSKGIKKMRIEVSGNICDIILKKDNVSTFILDEYALIKDALKTKKSFYDGF